MVSVARFFMIVLVLGLASCVRHQPNSASNQPAVNPIASVELVVDVDREDAFLSALRQYARSGGFEIWTDVQTSALGRERVFEMRRRDMFIFGRNSIREYEGNIPTTSNGYPDIEFDPTLFRVYFYPNEIQPEPSVVERAVDEFTSLMQRTDGVVLRRRSQP